LNNKGMTLVETLIAIGIAAVVAIGIGYVSMVAKSSTIAQKAGTESIEVVSSLSDWIYTQAACKSSFVTKPLTAAQTDLELNGYQGFGIFSSTPIKVGLVINNNLRIEKLTMGTKPGSPATSYNYNAQALTKKIAQIEIETEVTVPNNSDRAQRKRVLELPVLVDGGNIIRYCLSELTGEQACTLNGSQYDAGTGKCLTNVNCIIGGSYQVARAEPMGHGFFYSDVPNQVTGATTCPAGSTTQKVGESPHRWFRNYSCGKKCEAPIYDWIDYYVCIRCN
tara:strand:- start:142916 stop:143752 length:837 start_codon:yes stop_codon:yes gene_type:complete